MSIKSVFRSHRVSIEKHAKLIQEYQELRRRYDIEVAAHRGNCVSLDVEMTRRIKSEQDMQLVLAQVEGARQQAETMVANVAVAFQYLHDVAFPRAVHGVAPAEHGGDAVR